MTTTMSGEWAISAPIKIKRIALACDGTVQMKIQSGRRFCVIYFRGRWSRMCIAPNAIIKPLKGILKQITAAKEYNKKKRKKEIKIRIKNAPNKNILHFVWGRAPAKKRTAKKRKSTKWSMTVWMCMCLQLDELDVCAWACVRAFEVWFEPRLHLQRKKNCGASVLAKIAKSKNKICI